MTGADGEQQDAAYFHACNRGKKSVVINFATAEGQAQIRKLARESDVLIENFKVGGLAKYGLDYAINLTTRTLRQVEETWGAGQNI